MKYCLSSRQEHQYLQKANEIKVEYTNHEGYNNSLIITFEELEKYSENKL